MIILIASQKGGCGKTTVAVNLAYQLKQKNKSLAVIDADRQATLANNFKNSLILFQHYNNIKTKLIEYEKKYANVIVDVAGRDCEELRSSLLVADKVIVPFTPSQADISTLTNIDSIIAKSKEFNSKLIAYAMINNASTHYKNTDATDALKFIKAKSKFNILRTILHTRNCYRNLFSDSNATLSAKAKIEINNLTKELKLK